MQIISLAFRVVSSDPAIYEREHALTFVDTMARFGVSLDEANLAQAYWRTGSAFHDQLEQTFVILNETGRQKCFKKRDNWEETGRFKSTSSSLGRGGGRRGRGRAYGRGGGLRGGRGKGRPKRWMKVVKRVNEFIRFKLLFFIIFLVRIVYFLVLSQNKNKAKIYCNHNAKQIFVNE